METESARRRGSVLILALWSLSILAAFAVSLGYMVRQKVTLLERLERRQELWNAAWSGVERARAKLQEDVDAETDTFQDGWAGDSSFKEIRLPGAKLSIGYSRLAGTKRVQIFGIADEQSKLNLNVADPPAVSLLLQQVTTLDAESADRLAFAIVDWRDGDSTYGHPDFGAEDPDYESLPHPYEAKDRPYETLDELLLVKGMNHDIFEKMTPFSTVYGSGIVNVNTAGREVLVALGLPMTAADKLLRYRNGPDGLPATSDDRFFQKVEDLAAALAQEEPPPNEVERAALENLAGSGKVSVNTGFFGVTCRAESPDGRSEWTVDAVLNRDGNVLFCRSSGVRWT